MLHYKFCPSITFNAVQSLYCLNNCGYPILRKKEMIVHDFIYSMQAKKNLKYNTG